MTYVSNDPYYLKETIMPNYRELYEQEKERADLLQADLDEVDLIHFDECAALRAEIALLKQELARKTLN